jgi:hypothetical protein
MSLFPARIATTALSLALLAGCASVTVRPDGGPKLTTRPDYAQSKAYYFWGLGGVHTIDVAAICGERNATQFQSRYEALDVAYSIVTLGVYMPKTARVWCDRKSP